MAVRADLVARRKADDKPAAVVVIDHDDSGVFTPIDPPARRRA